MAKKTNKKNGQVISFEVTRAKEFDWGIVFDLEINDVMIYSCRLIDGEHGEFIAFPSYQGKDKKYYNHAWFSFKDKDAEEIIDAVHDAI